MNSLWMPLFMFLFFCTASFLHEAGVIFSEFANLLVNHCEGLHFHVIAPVPSLLRSVAVLPTNFENVLFIHFPHLAVEHFSEFSVDTSHSSSLINFLLVMGMNASPT